MRNFFKLPCLLVLLALQATSQTQQIGIAAVAIRNDTTILFGDSVRRLSSNFQFTEGPAADAEGNIYFTDQPADDIWKWRVDGTFERFVHGTGRANGLYVDKEGNLISCADEKNRILRITLQKKVDVLYKAPKKKRLNGPNDLWVDTRGGIYVTDPYYQRDYWKRKKSVLPGQYVYYLPPGKKQLITVAQTLKQPNGIVGTPDGKQLYIADIGDWKIYRFDIAPDGTLQHQQLFAAQGADGITLDNKGNLYLAGDGITIYNPAGQKIGHVPIPEKWTSNVCFGGPQKNQLFITASGSIYLLPMLVQGVE